MGQGDLGSATVELRNTSKSHFIVNSWWPQPIPHGTLVWQEAKMRKGPLRAVAHDGAISPMFKCPGLLLGPGDLRMAHLQFLGQAQKVRIPPELGDSGTVQTPFSSVVQDHRTPGTVGG